jgi:hypothetical protein
MNPTCQYITLACAISIASLQSAIAQPKETKVLHDLERPAAATKKQSSEHGTE